MQTDLAWDRHKNAEVLNKFKSLRSFRHLIYSFGPLDKCHLVKSAPMYTFESLHVIVIIPLLPEGGQGYTVLPLSVRPRYFSQ